MGVKITSEGNLYSVSINGIYSTSYTLPPAIARLIVRLLGGQKGSFFRTSSPPFFNVLRSLKVGKNRGGHLKAVALMLKSPVKAVIHEFLPILIQNRLSIFLDI